jgi:hypothetical protein
MRIRRIAAFTAVSTVLLVLPLAAVPAQAQTGPPVKIVKIHYRQTGTHLNTEYIVFKNTTGTTQTITGWKIISSPATDNQAYKFPVTKLAPGASLTLYTGRGTNTSTKRYWRSAVPVWNNSGDLAVLRNKAGHNVDTCQYAGGGTIAYC